MGSLCEPWLWGEGETQEQGKVGVHCGRLGQGERNDLRPAPRLHPSSFCISHIFSGCDVLVLAFLGPFHPTFSGLFATPALWTTLLSPPPFHFSPQAMPTFHTGTGPCLQPGSAGDRPRRGRGQLSGQSRQGNPCPSPVSPTPHPPTAVSPVLSRLRARFQVVPAAGGTWTPGSPSHPCVCPFNR